MRRYPLARLFMARLSPASLTLAHLPLALILTLALAPVALHADPVPYTQLGTITPYVPVYAASTGSLTFTYVRAGQTGFIDWITFTDVTQNTTSSPFFFNGGGSASAPGDTKSFAVVKGDLLDFTVYIGLAGTIPENSIPTMNADLTSHAYVTSFAGGTIAGATAYSYPAGLYVAMEDLPKKDADFNYNDEAFILTNATTTSAVPEPGTLSLLATGLLGAAGVARRKFLNR